MSRARVERASEALRAGGGEEMEEWLNGRTDCRLKMWWKNGGKKNGTSGKGWCEKRGGTYDCLHEAVYPDRWFRI